MKNLSSTYRLLATLVAFFVFAGASLPSGLHQKAHMMEDCDTMEAHSMHSMNKDMADHCDIGFACACSIEEAPVKTQAKVKVAPVVAEAAFIALFEISAPLHSDWKKPTVFISSKLADASPPLFLKNSTFLN